MSDQSEGGASRVIAVVGMHRSGTSWLAGTLEAMGLELGEVSTANPSNPYGTRESGDLQSVHDRILRANGGSWKAPPPSIRWTDDQLESLQDFVDQRDSVPSTWGFKDPRTVLLLDGWREVLGDRLQLAGVFRHPAAVMRSLEVRRRSRPRWKSLRSRLVPKRRFTGPKGRRLWDTYNRCLVDEHGRRPFPLVRFDQPTPALLGAVEAVGRELELPRPERAAAFLETSFVNQSASERRVHRSGAPIWDYLVANQTLP